MKKRLFVLLAAGMLCLTGCQSAEEKQQAEMMEAFEHPEMISLMIRGGA